MPGFPVLLHQRLGLAQTHVHRVSDAIQPSNPLLPPSPPAFNLSQHQDLGRIENLVSVFQNLKSRGEEDASVGLSILAKNAKGGLPLTSWQGPQKEVALGFTRQARP